MKYACLVFLFLSTCAWAQDEELNKKEREKYPTSFALQIRGLTNNRFIEPNEISLNNDTVISSIGSRYGFSFGGIIRRRYTESLGIELGLHHVKRYYNVSGSLPDSNLNLSGRFAFTNYELPINGLVFVKFSEEFFANVGLGITTIYKPSSILKQLEDKTVNKSFSFEGYAYRKFGFNINAQAGIEYKTEKSGTFYFGAAASIPTSPLFAFISVYRNPENGIRTDQGTFIRSPYFSVELRYYFPKIKNTGQQPNRGPIE